MPDELLRIGSRFIKGTGISEIVIPKNLAEVGGDVFGGAISLEKVQFAEGIKEIPYAMMASYSSVNYIKEIILPESLETIGADAFYGCKYLATVTIPQNVNTIGSQAFMGCTGLTSVLLTENDSIIRTDEGDELFSLRIEDNAFYGCSTLTEINLTQNVKYIGSHAFANTALSSIELPQYLNDIGQGFVSGTAIKSLTIPDSVVYAGQALDGATQLTSLTFADTMLNIPDYIGYNNESKSHLAEVTIPEGTLRIGDYAFANCLYLSTIVIPASVAEIGEYSFENTNVVLYVVKNSYAEKWAIDHDIDYRYSSVEPSESSDQVLEISGCSYYTNSDVMSANRRIPMYIRYKVKKAERKGVSDMSISIRLSSALDLVSGSVLVDDELTSDYDVNDHIITIPVDAYEGSIQFIAKPVTAGKIASYANFNYYTNTGSKSEMVGSLSLNVPTLTLEAPSKTSVPAIDISGIAGAKEKINLYIDNSKVSTVTARNDGAYSTSVTIPGTPVNGKSYTIKAEQNSDTDIFTTAKVTYSENTPVLAAFELYYNEHSSQMIDLLASKGAAQTISYLPGTSLTFRILFENTDAIKRVFVGSRKGKETRKMEALPTGKTGEYIASGYFDENDHDYLPGSVYIMYETNAELTDTVGEIGIRNDEVLSDDWKDAEFNEEVSDSEAGNYSGSVTNKNGDTVTYDIQTMDPETAGEELIGPDTGTISSASDVISVLKDKVTADPDVDVISSDSDSLVYYQSDNAIHYVFTEDNGRKLVSEVIKGPGKTVVKELFKNVFGFSSAGADGVATGIAGVANAIYVGHNTYVDITRARDQINSNKNLTAAQRTAALEKLDRMEKANAALSAIRLINTGIKVGLTVTGHPVAAALFGVVSNMFESISQSYIDKAIEYAQDGIVYDLRWLIDPSGYVYEAVTDNYISGAKATAWFKETDDSEPIIWNAAEDGQQNPLYTDEAGRYAWDTPEGLWQVVIEKEGYETWKSEWLPVPPIQNNVNASLISTANPKVEWCQLTNGQLEIQFTQFMKPDSIAGIKIFDAAGKEISYSIEYDKSQTNEEGECLADYYQLKFTANSIKEGERATVSIPSSLENYHGTTIKADEFKVLRQIERSVTVMKSTSVDYGKQITVPVTVNNATEDTVVNAISSSAAIIKVVSVEHDEDNIWNIKLFGAMPGKTDVIVSLNNSMISDVIEVETVNKGTAEDVVEVQSINIEGGVETLKVGQTLQLSGKIIPDNATDKTIIWSSDNTNIALVGSDGTVTAIKEGEVIITARAMVGNATDQCRILIIEDKEDQKKNIESAEVIGIVDKTYTGSPLTQSFTVKMGSTTLAETDYTISYSNNINVGTATLIIEGVGDYTGSITKTFNINKPNAPSSQEGSDDQTTPSGNIQPQIKTNISTAVVYGITTKVYTGSALT
ncbi:MAG: leucine-rich repeat protein [Eubacterium sp.]|nr:leucine-rich repeat protein [Eubacterium sp.]